VGETVLSSSRNSSGLMAWLFLILHRPLHLRALFILEATVHGQLGEYRSSIIMRIFPLLISLLSTLQILAGLREEESWTCLITRSIGGDERWLLIIYFHHFCSYECELGPYIAKCNVVSFKILCCVYDS